MSTLNLGFLYTKLASRIMAILGVMIISVPLHAQRKTLSPLIFCVAHPANLSELFAKKSKKNYTKIATSTANITEFTESLPKDGKFALYGPADASGKRPLAASAQLTTMEQPLIILNPATAGTEPPLTITVIDAEAALFPLGSYYLVNLSPYEIRLTEEKETIQIPSSGQHVFKQKKQKTTPWPLRLNTSKGKSGFSYPVLCGLPAMTVVILYASSRMPQANVLASRAFPYALHLASIFTLNFI